MHVPAPSLRPPHSSRLCRPSVRHATWNQFGTPKSLIKYGGYFATGLGSDPVAAAKTFITSNKALFRLSDAGVANLELLNDSPMTGSDGHAVLFRQTFGGLPATQDGLITVGVVNGKVAYVSSSSAGDGNATAAPVLGPQQAWLIAAASVGHSFSIVNLSAGKSINGWRTFTANGLNDLQRARLVAMPTPTERRPAGVRDDRARQREQRRTLRRTPCSSTPSPATCSTGTTTCSSLRGGTSAAESQTCESTGHLCSFDGTMNGDRDTRRRTAA